MNDREQRLAGLTAAGMVPAGYAEKTMASLLQLHSELMEEKERRVDLYRRLGEKEQTIAELRAYVKMLEGKLGAVSSVSNENHVTAPVVSSGTKVISQPPPPADEVDSSLRQRIDGWKQW